MRSTTRRYFRQIRNVTIDNPCPRAEELRRSGGAVSFCSECKKNVHHISRMTRTEAARVFAANRGKLCVSYSLNPDGTVRYKPPPPARTRLAAGGLLSLLAFVSRERLAVAAPPSSTKSGAAVSTPECAKVIPAAEDRLSTSRETSGGERSFSLVELAEAQGGGGGLSGAVAEFDPPTWIQRAAEVVQSIGEATAVFLFLALPVMLVRLASRFIRRLTRRSGSPKQDRPRMFQRLLLRVPQPFARFKSDT